MKVQEEMLGYTSQWNHKKITISEKKKKKKGCSRMGSEKKQTLQPGDFPSFKYETKFTMW